MKIKRTSSFYKFNSCVTLLFCFGCVYKFKQSYRVNIRIRAASSSKSLHCLQLQQPDHKHSFSLAVSIKEYKYKHRICDVCACARARMKDCSRVAGDRMSFLIPIRAQNTYAYDFKYGSFESNLVCVSSSHFPYFTL